jgi:hypothetical protein
MMGKNKMLLGFFAGLFLILMVGMVSATTLQTDVNEQLIIRSTCSGADSVSEISIYSGVEIIPDNLVVPRTTMTKISSVDFVFTTSFWQEGMYRAEIECIYGGGLHSFETVLINVTPPSNLILSSTKSGYDYEALMDYNVYFKSDATSSDSILFDISGDTVSFQPAELSVSGSVIVGCVNKTDKITAKRLKEDEKIAERRAREDKKLEQQRAREDAQLRKQREKEDKEFAKTCKKNSAETKNILMSQAPVNNGAFVDGNKFTYTNVYGGGLDLEYKVNKDYVKEELIIASKESLPQTNGTDLTLNLNSVMNTQSNIFVDGVLWNKTKPITTSNTVSIQNDEGKIIYLLEVPVVFDSNGEKVVGTYTLSPLSAGVKVSVQMPYDWFMDSARAYPVYLDPTIVWDGTSDLNGQIPVIVVANVTIPVNVPYTISEIITWGNETITDAECELDIIDDLTQEKVVDFRSFFNNQGVMEYVWTPPYVGNFTASQYCWRGDTLVLNKIYSISSIGVY